MNYDELMKDGFKPQKLVDEILNQLRTQAHQDYLLTPINEKGGDIIYRYNEQRGIYRTDGNPWLESKIHEIIGEKVNPGQISSVQRLMHINT